MVDLNGFDANAVEPAHGFDPIPAGTYPAVIIDSEMKPTRSGNGQYLELTFQITEGEHQNRCLWSRLNLENPNPAAVEIAQGELSAVCRAVGVLQPKDSSDLHDLPLLITVKCRKRQDTDEIVNEAKEYAPKEPPARAAPQNTPPWQRS